MTLPDFTPRQWFTTLILWVVVMASVGMLSRLPAVHPVAADETELKFIVRYSGKLLGECKQLDARAMEKLPPNMRQASVCPREKSPLFAELWIDDELRVSETVSPSGLHNDGVLAAYRNLNVRAGEVHVELKIRDVASATEFTHKLNRKLTFDPARIITIHFTDDGFRIRGA